MKKDIRRVLLPEGKTLVVGVGNDLRGDDGVGPYIAKKLLIKNCDKFKVLNAGPVIENFLDEIISFKPDKLIILDAAFLNGKSGDVKILDENKLSNYKMITTHSIPLPAILNIIREDLKNTKIFIVGIQPEKVDYSEELSPMVKKTADEIIKFLRSDYAKYNNRRTCFK